MKLGLIGYNIDASLSTKVHKRIFEKLGIEATYENVELQPNELTEEKAKQLLDEYDGFNITHPFKSQLLKYMEYLSPEVRRTQSQNLYIKNAHMHSAYTVDGLGFLEAYKNLIEGKKVVICGYGRTARAIIAAIYRHVDHIYVFSRREDIDLIKIKNISIYDDKTQADVFINCRVESNYYSFLANFFNLSAVIDINYKSEDKRAVEYCSENNVSYSNGLRMLIKQACLSDIFWFPKRKKDIEEAYEEIYFSHNNIVV